MDVQRGWRRVTDPDASVTTLCQLCKKFVTGRIPRYSSAAASSRKSTETPSGSSGPHPPSAIGNVLRRATPPPRLRACRTSTTSLWSAGWPRLCRSPELGTSTTSETARGWSRKLASAARNLDHHARRAEVVEETFLTRTNLDHPQ